MEVSVWEVGTRVALPARAAASTRRETTVEMPRRRAGVARVRATRPRSGLDLDCDDTAHAPRNVPRWRRQP